MRKSVHLVGLSHVYKHELGLNQLILDNDELDTHLLYFTIRFL